MKRTVCVGSRRIEYTLIRAARKDVLLQALPEGKTRVYAPTRMHLRDVDALVCARAEHLFRMHAELDRHLDEQRRTHPLGEGCEVSIEGRARALRLFRAPKVRMELVADEIHLYLPEPEREDAVRTALKSALSSLALARIRERIAHYHPQIGGEFGRVTVRDQKSRWGSCSSKHNLNFNWKLILAPPDALDYVVVHELCHLREFNHSPRFWRLVAAHMPDYEPWKKWLKIHAAELML